MGKRLLRVLTLVRGSLSTGDLGWKLLLIVELGLKESKRCAPLEFHKPMNKGFMGYFRSKFTSETQMRNEDLVTLAEKGDEKDNLGKKCLSK